MTGRTVVRFQVRDRWGVTYLAESLAQARARAERWNQQSPDGPFTVEKVTIVTTVEAM